MTIAPPTRFEATGADPTRARHPDETGFAERDGVRLYWETYGAGDPAVLFLNPGPILRSRMWKAQVPYLARHTRAVVFDGRGCGRSDRPRGRAAYRTEELAQDALAVLDATGVERCVIVTISAATRWALWLIAEHPERFAGAVFIGPYVPLTRWQPVETMRRTFLQPSRGKRAARMAFDTAVALPRSARSASFRRMSRQLSFSEAVDMYNAHTWLHNRRAYVEWLVRALNFAEAHSTRQIEDGIDWAMDADSQTLVDWWVAIDIDPAATLRDRDQILAYCRRVRCPTLVIQGEHDLAVPTEWGRALAEATGGGYLPVAGCGHQPQGRKPVAVNLALREFLEPLR